MSLCGEALYLSFNLCPASTTFEYVRRNFFSQRRTLL
jgi:hypothetical protein